MYTVLYTLLLLLVTGALAALLLAWAAKKFRVEEDPRIDEVESLLPGANCGGCGQAGCRQFAAACCSAGSLEGMQCPTGGADVMKRIGAVLGMEAADVQPKIAVVRCAGTCSARPKNNQFDGLRNCAVASSLYAGETGCAFGCLGFGDCAAACSFGGITINPHTGLPEVNPDLCTACGSCAKACPKHLIELRPRGPKDHRLYVACTNREKGAEARKACTAACIGCGKCVKECAFEAITLQDNLAYIDPDKCRLCRKCEAACPTGAIHAVNFPPKKTEQA
ncbi:MAG: RnfABCDGE type electron transport complex subunit B [Paludibacteraceae bacterium]|nr:RnfABCDGE type electron transport complex subunit B [Paludibacteraceae bacterium]